MRTIFVVISLLLTLSMYSDEKWATLLKKEFISEEKEDFDCHSSSIIETVPGSFCAVWKGGFGKGQCNIDMKINVGIWLSLYSNGMWSEPKEIVTTDNSICWNPVLCKLSNQEVILFFRLGKDPRQAIGFLKRSFDGGNHWTQEELLPAGILGPTKGKPIVTPNGTWICPSSIQAGDPQDAFKATAIWIDIATDNGKQWKKIGPLELPHRKFGVIEPVLFYDNEGHLKLLCRDRAHKIGEKGCLWTAWSQDDGLTWSDLKPTCLPNPDSGIDVVDLGNGKIVLFYNHSYADRYPLHIAMSLDGGISWSDPWVLDETGEFPSGCLSSDGQLHITYAVASSKKEQRRIRHVIIPNVNQNLR